MRIKLENKKNIIVTIVIVILFIAAVIVVSKWMKKSKDVKTADHIGCEVESQSDKDNIGQSASEVKEKEDYENEFLEQSPAAKTEGKNTYRIYEDTCSISYNHGKDWIKVPLEVAKLCDAAYGNPYLNQLQKGSYILDEDKVIFTFGGTQKNDLSIIKSTNHGETWKTIPVETGDKIVRYAGQKFISFPSKNVGYIVVTSEKTMNSEGKVIFRTTDAGDNFTRVKLKTNINEHFLHNAVFLTEQLGFMSMQCEEEPELYRTDDGGKTWNTIKLPLARVEGLTPFSQPEVPYKKDGNLYLLVGQGENADYKGGLCKAIYISEDDGKSFRYTGKIEK